MNYKVTKQYGRGAEQPFLNCNDLSDIKAFVALKLKQDAQLNIKVVYRVYEFSDLIQTFDPINPAKSTVETAGEAAGEKSQGSRFSPTPLPTGLKPPGAHKWAQFDDSSQEDEQPR